MTPQANLKNIRQSGWRDGPQGQKLFAQSLTYGVEQEIKLSTQHVTGAGQPYQPAYEMYISAQKKQF
jgi:hypothetical protein